MRILLDQDQVICKWTEKVLEWYNQDYKTNIKRDEVTDWGIASVLGPQGRDFIRSCMRYPEFYRDLDPVEGAIDGVKSLVDDGHDVIIATAVPKSAGVAYHGKLEWIRRNMPFFDLNHLVALQRKELLTGDLLLDDGPHNIEAFMRTGRTTVVFDCPWNQASKGTHRIKDWPEFLTLVKKLQYEKDFKDSLPEPMIYV